MNEHDELDALRRRCDRLKSIVVGGENGEEEPTPEQIGRAAMVLHARNRQAVAGFRPKEVYDVAEDMLRAALGGDCDDR